MWNTPTASQLHEIPRLYENEDLPLGDKPIYLHFFIGGCDWYVTEYDGRDLFFGYAILNNDFDNAEWGYFSFTELKSIRVGFGIEIDCDLHWQIRPASQVERIKA